MSSRAVFLDVDGVLADNTRLPLEYERLLGTVLAPALGRSGRTPDDWMLANRVVFPRVVAQCLDMDVGPLEVDRRLRALCVQGMCRELGIAPPGDDEAAALAKEYDRLVRATGDYFFPDAADVVRALAAEHPVHMASGNLADLMEIVLGRLGVRDLIGVPCGSDLVGIRKDRPGFYEALFALAGTDAADAVVVDDVPTVLDRAAALGAHTILIAADGGSVAGGRFDAVLASARDLPATIRSL